MTVRVLIVDDQEPFRSVAREVVEAVEGFEVVAEAETGEDSVSLAKTEGPDLVLMDVNLPGIDGVEATRRILRDRPATKVMLLSTYAEDELAGRAQECGAFAYATKSAFDPDKLEAVWAAANG